MNKTEEAKNGKKSDHIYFLVNNVYISNRE